MVGNETADTLAREAALDLPIAPLSLPRSDYKCYIRRLLRDAWQAEWHATVNNKLRAVLPTIPPRYINPYPRLWMMKLTRLRIGHTRLTHEHLITGRPPPYCDDCIVPLTVEHILLECPSHQQHRQLFGFPGPPTLAAMFADVYCGVNGPLFQFLIMVDIFNSV